MEAQDLNNILVVDDTPDNLHLLADILKKCKYKVRPVPNGKLALGAAEINPPDLIILDIMMPDLDGYQVCKQLKSNPKTRNIPVIFISAIDDPVDKVKAFAIGGVDYITKPFQTHDVLIRVKNQLAVYSLQQKLKAKNEQLKNSISQLKQAQRKLIKSEKSLILDKIITGIINQISCPLSKIDASLSEINKFPNSSSEKLPVFLQNISTEQQKYFAALLKQAQQKDLILPQAEKQELKSKIIAQLDVLKLPDSETVADAFLALGCDEKIDAFLPLLTEKNYLAILENACLVNSLDKNIKNIAKSTTQFYKIFSAFKDYSGYKKNEQKRQAHIQNTIEMGLKSYCDSIPPGIKIIKNHRHIPPTYCYPEELQIIWKNLIDNAVTAMGERGTLSIDLDQQQNNIIVTITNTGPVIAKEIICQICDPFFTTKLEGENVGLGLTIVKQIIEKHDGTIAVKSSPEKTSFTVSFPFVQQIIE